MKRHFPAGQHLSRSMIPTSLNWTGDFALMLCKLAKPLLLEDDPFQYHWRTSIATESLKRVKMTFLRSALNICVHSVGYNYISSHFWNSLQGKGDVGKNGEGEGYWYNFTDIKGILTRAYNMSPGWTGWTCERRVLVFEMIGLTSPGTMACNVCAFRLSERAIN